MSDRGSELPRQHAERATPELEIERLAEAQRREEELNAVGAIEVMRRGIAVTPELRAGLGFTVVMGVVNALGRLAVPVLIQQALDKGVLNPHGFDGGYVYRACAATFVAVIGAYFVGWATYRRLIRAAEDTLYGLRVRVFAHIHALAIADHEESRRGLLVSRVTSDIETLARFVEWGAVSWIINGTMVVGVIIVMFVYSWPLALVTTAAFVPLAFLLQFLQRRQLKAYDVVRTRVGDTLSEFSEAIGGAAVIRSYGLQARAHRRLRSAIREQYRAELRAGRFTAVMFPLADVFGALALAGVAGVGAWYGPGWGLSAGDIIAMVFLVTMIITPIAELSEVIDQTQTALAGWRKVLSVLEIPIAVPEPTAADVEALPAGPIEVTVEGLRFAYRTGPEVLQGIDVHIPAGSSVAVVGETGSGKTTFVKLLCRLADPTAGRVLLNGIDGRDLSDATRTHSIRMVPQDGFLFDATVRENVQLGRLDAGADDLDRAVADLGLEWWVAGLPQGLDTPVGERGSALSVGERQLVALVRAQLSDPGLLVLDEATSAVDPENDQAIADALARVSDGRTTVSVAHRLSTAERADRVLVFDAGLLVEEGSHADLVAAGGVYARLHASWLGATRTT